MTGAAHKSPSAPLAESCPGDDAVPPRDFGLRIARDGTWSYLGSPIQRPALVKLFSTVLSRDEDGRFWLITPVERGTIHVDDAPFVAVDVDLSPPGGTAAPGSSVTFTTNLGETVVADADHPIRLETDPKTGEPAPYILVRDGLEALINRATYYRLVEMAVARTDGSDDAGVWSGGMFHPLGRTE